MYIGLSYQQLYMVLIFVNFILDIYRTPFVLEFHTCLGTNLFGINFKLQDMPTVNGFFVMAAY